MATLRRQVTRGTFHSKMQGMVNKQVRIDLALVLLPFWMALLGFEQPFLIRSILTVVVSGLMIWRIPDLFSKGESIRRWSRPAVFILSCMVIPSLVAQHQRESTPIPFRNIDVQIPALIFRPKQTPEVFAVFKNNDAIEISPDAVIRLGITPFKKANLKDNRMYFVQPITTIGILANDTETFKFATSSVPYVSEVNVVYVTALIYDPRSPHGFGSSTRYTWTAGEARDPPFEWLPLQGNAANVNGSQIDHVSQLVNQVKACLWKHSKDGKFDQCFPQEGLLSARAEES